MFTKEFLLNVRRKALRRGFWYGILDSAERGILFISAKIIETVKSDLLNIQIVKIIAKLQKASKSTFTRQIEQYGRERAKTIQKQAIIFGYKGSERLSNDIGFIRYLIFLDHYQPLEWKMAT